MSGNVRLNWVNPTEKIDDAPATDEDIKEIRIDARQQAATQWARVATLVDPARIAAATHLFTDTPNGTWVFQVGGIDKRDQEFDQWEEVTIVVVSGPVESTAPLKGVSELTASLEV